MILKELYQPDGRRILATAQTEKGVIGYDNFYSQEDPELGKKEIKWNFLPEEIFKNDTNSTLQR